MCKNRIEAHAYLDSIESNFKFEALARTVRTFSPFVADNSRDSTTQQQEHGGTNSGAEYARGRAQRFRRLSS